MRQAAVCRKAGIPQMCGAVSDGACHYLSGEGAGQVCVHRSKDLRRICTDSGADSRAYSGRYQYRCCADVSVDIGRCRAMSGDVRRYLVISGDIWR
jgi:hypothetical protein